MEKHVFVVMPYHTKENIHFDEVYSNLIKPALESSGFIITRADELSLSGDIRVDMFQDLLLADLVIADLSIANPNVWYEVGVRHALRARGIVHIKCNDSKLPFDLYTERTLTYRIKDGKPDPAYLEEDKRNLSAFAENTINAWKGRKNSPVYSLLPYLKEPDWKSLKIGNAKEFWDDFNAWESKVKIARQNNRFGDVMVFAQEIPDSISHVLKKEAHLLIGDALISLNQFKLANDQFDKVLIMEPDNLHARQKIGLLMGRLNRHAKAKELLETLVNENPDEPESRGLLGRVEKDAWIYKWRKEGTPEDENQKEALSAVAWLYEAIEQYTTGFKKRPGAFYPGINALTLLYLKEHLTGNNEDLEEKKAMEGGVHWAVQCALLKNPKDYWARVTLADLKILTCESNDVESAYRSAIAVANNNWFWLDSSRQQLLILKELGFRKTEVDVALKVFEVALRDITPPWVPSKVFLFSGHMIDAPNRKSPRFTPSKEPNAIKYISDQLQQLNAGPTDIGLCGGACGGDIIFAEACLERGMRLEIRLPYKIPEFIAKSIAFAGSGWRDRFYKIQQHRDTSLFIMPDELGPTPNGINDYARNNRWQLYTALTWGAENVRFICLWDGKSGDGPGGTKHMHEEISSQSGHIYLIDINKI